MECTLCADTFTFFGLTECEHKEVCSLCWFRMLVQLKSNNCPVCRTTCQTIFIVSDTSLSYSCLFSTNWNETYQGFTKDLHSGLYFSSKHELNRLISFKKVSCQLCKVEFRNVTEYKNHAKEVHKKVLCEQCMQSSKLFPSEQSLFEENELTSHKNSLHKKCNVCGNFFYDASSLVAHIKNSHYFCDFCPFEHRVAYLNHQSLEKHYIEKHYYCELLECKKQKCFVFRKYEDLQEHYRREHPGQPVPKPAMGFRVAVEEEKCVFEDNSQKRGQPASVSTTMIDFPALGDPSKSNSRALDYSKVIQKPGIAWAKQSFVPADRLKSPKPNVPAKPNEKPAVRSEFSERLESPPKPSLLETNISRLNNQNMTKEKFIEFVRNEGLIIDNQLKKKLREKISSNSDREAIIYQLEKPNQLKQKDENINLHRFGEKKLENFGDFRQIGKIRDEDKFGEEKKVSFKVQPDQIRPVVSGYNSQFDELSEKNTETLLENICLLNINLIEVEDFTTSIKEFIHSQQLPLALEIIQANLKEKSNFQKIFQYLNKSPARPKNIRNYNPGNNRFIKNQPEPKPLIQKSPEFPPVNHEEIKIIEETLTEGLAMYNSKLVSISEMTRDFALIISPGLKEMAFEIIRKRVKDSNAIIDKLNELIEKPKRDDERASRERGHYNRRGFRRPRRNN